ncbi:PEP-CTERM sorting domain-containing protein [Akkermansiaceae bacterium]|nr:PEP-CTERM sorting domain-containing protein [Akkermansiaceae bacterium]
MYLSFTLTPGAGATIDLTTFTMDMGITNGTAAKLVGVFSDVGGFSSDADAIGTQNWTGTAGGTETDTIDLSSLPRITAATEFRIYMITNASTASHGFALDNITFEGTVTVVPEPSAFALLGIAALGLLRRRR